LLVKKITARESIEQSGLNIEIVNKIIEKLPKNNMLKILLPFGM
jgi:hypothetical protein